MIIQRIQRIIDGGVTCGAYTPTTDNTLKDLKNFFDFLYRNFKDHPKYEKMLHCFLRDYGVTALLPKMKNYA